MTIDYDKSADVLYLTFAAAQGKVRYVDNGKGCVLRIDSENERVVGCTVLNFMDRMTKGEGLTVPEVQTVAFNDELLSLIAGR